jgi:hypothetical protein
MVFDIFREPVMLHLIELYEDGEVDVHYLDAVLNHGQVERALTALVGVQYIQQDLLVLIDFLAVAFRILNILQQNSQDLLILEQMEHSVVFVPSSEMLEHDHGLFDVIDILVIDGHECLEVAESDLCEGVDDGVLLGDVQVDGAVLGNVLSVVVLPLLDTLDALLILGERLQEPHGEGKLEVVEILLRDIVIELRLHSLHYLEGWVHRLILKLVLRVLHIGDQVPSDHIGELVGLVVHHY